MILNSNKDQEQYQQRVAPKSIITVSIQTTKYQYHLLQYIKN